MLFLWCTVVDTNDKLVPVVVVPAFICCVCPCYWRFIIAVAGVVVMVV
jgi:hypothetical protein